MSKREDLPLTLPKKEPEVPNEEDETYGFSNLRVSPRVLSPHNRSPQKNSPAQIRFSESSSSGGGAFGGTTLQRPSTLRLSFSSEEDSSSIKGEIVKTYSSHYSQIGARGSVSYKTSQSQCSTRGIGSDASPSPPNRYQWSPRLIGYSDASPPSPSRSVSHQWKLTGSSEASPTSPSRSLPGQLNPRLTESSRASPPSPSKSLSNQRSSLRRSSRTPSPSISRGTFRSYTIQKPWNPKGPGFADDPSERQEQAFETFPSSFRRPVPPGSPRKQIDSSGIILANSPSPSGGTFRSYSIERSWSPKGPGSPQKAPEYCIKDERVYQVHDWSYQQIASPGPGSPQSAKNPWSFRQTESPPSPSRGILRKTWNPRVPDSPETLSEMQRIQSGRTFSPCTFSPRASPDTSRPTTPMYLRETASNLISPRQLRVTFSTEPDEIADFELSDKKFDLED